MTQRENDIVEIRRTLASTGVGGDYYREVFDKICEEKEQLMLETVSLNAEIFSLNSELIKSIKSHNKTLEEYLAYRENQ